MNICQSYVYDLDTLLQYTDITYKVFQKKNNQGTIQGTTHLESVSLSLLSISLSPPPPPPLSLSLWLGK